jgi:uracil phosphoribosyltransferase
MVSRALITLTLVSSLFASSAYAEHHDVSIPVHIEIVQKKYDASSAVYSNNVRILGAVLGLVSGVACSMADAKVGFIFSWLAEDIIRYGLIYKVMDLPRDAAHECAAASSIGSWIGYLGHKVIPS